MNTAFNFKIGDTTYTTEDFKNELDKATPTFNNWSGARKISLGGKEFKYDEILKVVSNKIHEKNQSGEDNDQIHELVKTLIKLKDAGHEKTNCLYTLFRRVIPNAFRARNISNLESVLKDRFPSTEQLKTYVKDNKLTTDSYLNYYSEITNPTIYEAALIADFLISKDSNVDNLNKSDLLNDLWKKNPSFEVNILKILDPKQLPICSKILAMGPSKVLITELKSVTDINDAYNLYNRLTPEERKEIFQGIVLEEENHTIYAVRNGNRVNLSALAKQMFDIKENIVPEKRETLIDKLNQDAKPEKINETIHLYTSYIHNTIFGAHHDTDKNTLIQIKMPERVIEETNWLVETLKNGVTEENYQLYIKNYLKNPDKNPVLSLAKAAILADYYKSNPPKEKEYASFITRLSPESASIVFRQIDEELFKNSLDILRLPEILEQFNVRATRGEITPSTVGSNHHQQDIAEVNKDEIEFTRFNTTFDDSNEPITPYLQKLLYIYTFSPESLRTKYFLGLKLRDSGGKVQLSRDGQKWVSIF